MPAPALDKTSSVPLYRQIENILRAELGHGAAVSGALTEMALTERFGVSRYTVRQALERLRRDGLISRQKKLGTFPVNQAVIEQPLDGLYSFGRSLSGRGLATESRVLSCRAIQPSDHLASQLHLARDGQPVVELIRLRGAEGEPLILETIWLAEVLVPGIFQLDLTGSVYDLLRDRYGMDITSAQESIRPVVLDARRARLLQVSRGAPAFFVERLSYRSDEPVEVRHSVIRGDRYLYSVRLNTVPASPA